MVWFPTHLLKAQHKVLVESLLIVTDTTEELKLQTSCKQDAYNFQRDSYIKGVSFFMDKNRKWNDALTIFTESVHKPDTKLRSCAHNQECYDELMEVREHVLNYLTTIRR